MQPKLLVVDDSEICRKPFREMGVDSKGNKLVEILEAVTGEEGVELFIANPSILYAVVDVHLPGIDGFEMLKQWRAHDREHFEQVTIFMSCTDAEEHMHDDLGFPMPSWIVKPVDAALFNSFLLSDVRMHMAMNTDFLNEDQQASLRSFFEAGTQLTENQRQALVRLIGSLTSDD